MPETYRDQWEAAANVLRTHAIEFDRLAREAPPRPPEVLGTTRDALKIAVCEYLLEVNRSHDNGDGHYFIPPTAIDWLGNGIVDAIVTASNDRSDDA